jgi:Ca-activated chloride channel homolog
VTRPAGARLFICLCLVAAAAFGGPPPAARLARATQSDASRPGQQPRPPRPRPEEVLPEDEILRVDTDLILVDVAVTDAKGRPVRNLRAEDFRLYEDGVERPVAFFNVERRGGERRPVAVVFAVDVSGSVSPEEMARVAEAVRAFSERLDERESVFALMSFGMSARVLQGFTNSREKLTDALRKLVREAGAGASTHAYDAVDDAVRLLARRAPRTRDRRPVKRVVVVVTDGFPVGDTVAPETVIERANAEEVSVYSVTLPSFSRALAPLSGPPLPTPFDVSGLVEKTGGSNVYATGRDFEPLFKSLAEEVVSTYVLAFYPPPGHRGDGRYRQIRVTTRPGLNVRQSRPGYRG